MNRSIAMLLIGLIFGGGIGFTIAAGSGVTLDGHDHSEHLMEDTGAAAHDHDKITVLPAGPDAPTIDIDVIKDGTGWNLHVTTANFVMTPEKVGTRHVAGEGHGHVYLNGVKQARLYGEWYHIDSVPSGEVELRVTLNSNDHSALAVGDQLLEATVTLPGT